MTTTESEQWKTWLTDARRAWREGEALDALQLCDRAALMGKAARHGAALLRGHILLELGDAAGALSSYDSIADPSVPDPELDGFRGIALLEQARFAEAENALASALRGAPENADVQFALGIIAEVHNSGREVEFFRRARRLAPQRFAARPRYNQAEFEVAITEALSGMGPAVRRALRRVPVLVTEVPDPDYIRRPTPAISPLAFGMWVPLEDANIDPAGTEVTRGRGLLLFKRNIERASPDRAALLKHVRTFVHDELEEQLGPGRLAELENASSP